MRGKGDEEARCQEVLSKWKLECFVKFTIARFCLLPSALFFVGVESTDRHG
jgi:hypothetical protein